MSFITGSEAGKHWIVPGTYISNNFDISYGLGELSIQTAELTVEAVAGQGKTYGEADPVLTSNIAGFKGSEDQSIVSGELIREPGEDVGDYRILLGSLSAGPNYAISYSDAIFSIEQANLTVEAVADQGKTYGQEEQVLLSTITGLVGDDQVAGELSREPGEDAGSYEILLGSLDAGPNYNLSFTGASFTIEQADLSVEAIAGQGKTYGEGDPVLLSTITGLVGEDQVSGTLSRDAGEDVGTYGILLGSLSAGPNYNLSFMGATFTIEQADLTVGANDLSKTYGEADPVLLTTVTGLVGEDQVFGELSREPGEDVGEYGILIGSLSAGPNYNLSFMGATFTITKKLVYVTPNQAVFYINEKDPLPSIAFYYDGWIAGDGGNEGFTVIRDTDGVTYTASSNSSAGTYTLTPETSNSNYNYSFETGILHVNPYGPGTRAVRPVLNCIEELEGGIFIANFEYMNNNDVTVHIPVGPDNLLEGTGIDWAQVEQPTAFLPGGGSFVVFFDGTELSWTVSRRDNKRKVSNAANANSSSTKCNNNLKSAAVSVGVEEEPEFNFEDLRVYPNPVVEKLHVALNGIEEYKAIMIYDMAGNVYPIESIEKRSNLLEIDMAALSPGAYFIRIVMKEDSKVVTVIKN